MSAVTLGGQRVFDPTDERDMALVNEAVLRARMATELRNWADDKHDFREMRRAMQTNRGVRL